ncbi:adenylosuccinate synthase [Pseudomonas aeruginosa]|uniref:hypothetical protein n=1 Tax=Pseudomonas aeruginosa group TaxID=136841 RepID=UPI00044629C0|nr:hypothetical protein [Pseudomonas aeruginosa]EIU2716254.1 adenylosuccinate synthase [Pseudomonas aeruginosa]EIU2863073.1 adenylosuccinate synthase [Pseudomonas aeruginosa]ELD5772957.1 adenylosuccinate synthase [Pseudomonas aeruginosa]ETV28694.1 hypothetical protein Q046_05611 [Pseudomonas aeruginosa BWHPSA041]ETV55767.1 hypothetical protein Q042_05176 [Pseudomonas aeruginosa BWHPSA037]
MNHGELCELAKKWLLRQNSKGGHGCHTALSECRSGWGGEMPDAIGYRAATSVTETVVVEVKVSRADFLADAKKPHRAPGKGMGIYRYFMCPAGLINPEEVPERWGLLWVHDRGRIEAKLGPVALSNNCGTFEELALPWRHEREIEREQWLLVRVMSRIADPDKLRKSLNDGLKEQARLAGICNQQAEELRRLRDERVQASWANTPDELKTATPRKIGNTPEVDAGM